MHQKFLQKKISVLGSTGSIGVNTLNVARHLGIPVVGLAAYKNIDLLEEQIREFNPEKVAVYDHEKALELKKRLPHVAIVAGLEGLAEVACLDSADILVAAMSGTLGISPTAAAIRLGKTIALANKEILVSAGKYIQGLAKKYQVRLIPVDSEHSALFQCLEGEEKSSVRRLILTASGGPFYRFSKEQLAGITTEDALRHPNWKMGPKITIDSSTLMNKGLEVIEAHWLFELPVEKIEVVIHPQSIIHSMVEFCDGSMMAQLCEPDMKLPIQYALTYPSRQEGILAPFDFTRARSLEFYPSDPNQFRCLHLAFEALKRGKSSSCYLNAANEILVQRFLDRQISWQDISKKLEILLERHNPVEILDLDEILEVDTMAREQAHTI